MTPRARRPLGSRLLNTAWTAAVWAWRLVAWSVLVGAIGCASYLAWLLHNADTPGVDVTVLGPRPPEGRVRPVITNHTERGTAYTIDNAYCVFLADVGPPEALFTNFADAVRSARQRGRDVIPSVDLIHGQCKAFNDRLVLRIERWLQSERQPLNKRQALGRLLDKLTDPEAYLHVATALHLGGAPPDERLGRQAGIERRAAAFRSAAAPLGAWEDSEAQRRIFLQDRYLMDKGLRGPALRQVVEAIAAEPGLDAFFRFLDRLDARRINPPADRRAAGTYTALAAADLDTAERDGTVLHLLPYRDSPEERLMKHLRYSTAEGFVDELAEALRSGAMSLAPTADSGWYDHQIHALETLLLPERAEEAAKLRYSDAYLDHLRESFKGGFTADRETQIKALPVVVTGMSMSSDQPMNIVVRPSFSAEPTATVYLRLARSYRFLHRVLREDTQLSSEILDSIARQARRLHGLYDRLGAELGLPAPLEDECDWALARAAAEEWLSRWEDDPLLAPDVRAAVPVVERLDRSTTCFGIAGVTLVPARYEFHEDARPAVRGPVQAEFRPRDVVLPARVFVEFREFGAPPTRAAFRERVAGKSLGQIRREFPPLTPPDLVAGPWLRWGGLAMLVLITAGIWRKGPNWIVTRGVAVALVAGGIVAVTPALRVPLQLQVAARSEIYAVLMSHRLYGENRPAVLRGLGRQLESANPQIRYLAAQYLAMLAPSGRPESPSVWDELRDPVFRQAENPDNPPETVLTLVGMFGAVDPGNSRELWRDRLDEATHPVTRRSLLYHLAQEANADDEEIILRGLRDGDIDLSLLEYALTEFPTRSMALAMVQLPKPERGSRVRVLAGILNRNAGALTDEERCEFLPGLILEEPARYNVGEFVTLVPDRDLRVALYTELIERAPSKLDRKRLLEALAFKENHEPSLVELRQRLDNLKTRRAEEMRGEIEERLRRIRSQ